MSNKQPTMAELMAKIAELTAKIESAKPGPGRSARSQTPTITAGDGETVVKMAWESFDATYAIAKTAGYRDLVTRMDNAGGMPASGYRPFVIGGRSAAQLLVLVADGVYGRNDIYNASTPHGRSHMAGRNVLDGICAGMGWKKPVAPGVYPPEVTRLLQVPAVKNPANTPAKSGTGTNAPKNPAPAPKNPASTPATMPRHTGFDVKTGTFTDAPKPADSPVTK